MPGSTIGAGPSKGKVLVDLASEDVLRLNVLLANARAIRIDEAQCTVYGRADAREYQVRLNPGASPEKYLHAVRSFLSTAVFGSPRHFPTHLRRWAGQGQFSNAPLEKLLLLGDADAVYAVANSPSVTVELGAYAWWAAPEPEIARALLGHPQIVADELGRTLARWLLEYLPFEADPTLTLRNLMLLLQPGLLDTAVRQQLWERGRRKSVIRVAFLRTCPDAIPAGARMASPDSDVDAGADFLLCASTQRFVAATLDALPKLVSQDETVALIEAIGNYFARFAPPEPTPAIEVVDRTELDALRYLAGLRPDMLTPVFAHSDASGSVMRQQIAGVVQPVVDALVTLSRHGRTGSPL